MSGASRSDPRTLRGGTLGGADARARLRWTSVPRWPAPALPPAASYLACCFGGEGERRARALLSGASPAVPVRAVAFADRWAAAAGLDEAGAGEDIDSRLRALFGSCLAGVRIILAGPESVVMRAASVARQCGAVSEELVLIAVEAAPPEAGEPGAPGGPEGGGAEYVAWRTGRRVFCAACRRPFDAFAALGDIVTCPGCDGQLIVDHRFSRPHAAYFGWPTGLDLHR